MKKVMISIVCILAVANVALAVYFNQRIVTTSLEDKIEESIAYNCIGNFSPNYEPEKYVIERANLDNQLALEKIIEESDLIVRGKLHQRQQKSELVESKINVTKFYKGEAKEVNIGELYYIDDYGNGITPNENNLHVLDPFYCAINSETEYIFFLKEIASNTYTYLDRLYTKVPINHEVKIGKTGSNEEETVDDEIPTHIFPVSTFFSDDIQEPNDYRGFFKDIEEYNEFFNDQHPLVNYTDLYVDFCSKVRELYS